MLKDEKNASILGIVGNAILFLGKIVVGLLYNSIAIISDALNSFTDIISSVIVHISLVVSNKKADKGHQFGHERAEPIAGLIVAVFTGIVGFEVIINSITRIMEGSEVEKGILPLILVIMVMIIKFLMYIYTEKAHKKGKSAALKASSIDHRNDIIVSFSVLIGLMGANYGYPILDPIVAIMIGIYIIKSGFDITKDNLRFLMGEAPDEELFKEIEKSAKSIKGVIGINDIRAHYVGTIVQAEVHIYVDKNLSVEKAHDIGKRVEKKLEKKGEISKAFIHIDPFEGKFVKERKF